MEQATGSMVDERDRLEVVTQRGSGVAILGHTTGSHLGLRDDEESSSNLLWVAAVVDGTSGAGRSCTTPAPTAIPEPRIS
jgi:hypothetical protein